MLYKVILNKTKYHICEKIRKYIELDQKQLNLHARLTVGTNTVT